MSRLSTLHAKSKVKNQDRPLVFTQYTWDQFLNEGGYGLDAFNLYTLLIERSNNQKTNCVLATNSYINKKFGWGERRIKATKDVLLKAGLISIIRRHKKNGDFDKCYIKVNHKIRQSTEDRVMGDYLSEINELYFDQKLENQKLKVKNETLEKEVLELKNQLEKLKSQAESTFFSKSANPPKRDSAEKQAFLKYLNKNSLSTLNRSHFLKNVNDNEKVSFLDPSKGSHTMNKTGITNTKDWEAEKVEPARKIRAVKAKDGVIDMPPELMVEPELPQVDWEAKVKSMFTQQAVEAFEYFMSAHKSVMGKPHARIKKKQLENALTIFEDYTSSSDLYDTVGATQEGIENFFFNGEHDGNINAFLANDSSWLRVTHDRYIDKALKVNKADGDQSNYIY